jgi:hypothetical protein
MRTTKTRARSLSLSFLLLPLLIAGCVQIEEEIDLAQDGSGQRSITVTAPNDDDEGMTVDEFQALFGLTARRGWSHSREKRENEEVHIFRKTDRAERADAWAGFSGDILVRGTLKEGPYEGVRFRNDVKVTVQKQGGRTTFWYEELFSWEGLVEAVVQERVARALTAIKERYPGIGPERTSELKGVLRASCRVALCAEWPDGTEPIADAVAPLVAGILSAEMDPIDTAFVEKTMHEMVVDPDQADEEFLNQHLPGAALAGITEYNVRLRMPGEVEISNADVETDESLQWSFSGWDAVARPIRVYAQSTIRD